MSVVGRDRTPPNASAADAGTARPHAAALWMREILAGLVTTFVAIPMCLAIGTLAFSPLGPSELAAGALAGMVGAAIGGIVFGVLQPASFMVGSPSSSTGLLLTGLAASLVATMPDADARTVIVALGACVLFAGLIMVAFGLSGFGRVIAYTPQPVFAGFVSGVGVLIMIAQIPRALGASDWRRLAGRLMDPGTGDLVQLAFGALLVAFMIWLGGRRTRLPPVASGFILGTATYHLLGLFAPQEWFGPPVGALPSWSGSEIGRQLLSNHLGIAGLLDPHLGAIMTAAVPLAIVASIEGLLTRRLAESLADLKRNPRRNLVALGVASLASGLAGGIAVTGAPAQLNANFRAGGRTRRSALVCPIAILLLVLVVPGATELVPTIVPSSILVVVGLRMVDVAFLRRAGGLARRSGGDARQRARFDLVTFAIVMLPTAAGSLIVGVAAGVVISTVVFLIRMGRPIVRSIHHGDSAVSKRIRVPGDMELLRRHGRETAIVEAEGVLFFGNADDLSIQLDRLGRRCRRIVLDLHRVADIDTTGASILGQAVARAAERGCTIAMCAAAAGLRDQFADLVPRGLLFRDLDAALEWAEGELLAARGEGGDPHGRVALEEVDLCHGIEGEDRAVLMSILEPVTFPAQAELCHAGDDADRLWMIVAGEVSIRASASDSVRIAARARGTTVGEMALLEGGQRSATVIADEPVEAYVLRKADFERLLREHPRLANLMLHNLARELVRRLRVTSAELARKG